MQRQHRMLVGQPLAERCGEGLACGAGGLRGGDQRRGRGHLRVAGEGPDGRGADHLNPRAAPCVLLDRPFRRGHRAGRRVDLRVLGVAGQRRFVTTPRLRLGLVFGGFQRLHREVDGQRRRRQLEDVRRDHRDRQHRVRRRVPDAILEQAAQSWLVVDGHHHRLDTAEQARPAQHPPRDRGAHTDGGGADP